MAYITDLTTDEYYNDIVIWGSDVDDDEVVRCLICNELEEYDDLHWDVREESHVECIEIQEQESRERRKNYLNSL